VELSLLVVIGMAVDLPQMVRQGSAEELFPYLVLGVSNALPL
jgi:hypothetical protein